MAKVSKTNYLSLLQETIAVLSEIQAFLGENRAKNRIEIGSIGQSIKVLDSVVRTERRKSLAEKNKNIYQQQVQREIMRKTQLLEQMRQLHG